VALGISPCSPRPAQGAARVGSCLDCKIWAFRPVLLPPRQNETVAISDEELLSHAVGIVELAGALAARRFLEGSPESVKGDGSVVTAADIEVEELVRAQLAERFPGDGVLGEEQGETASVSGRRWIADAIDGTSYFARRIPAFLVTLAAEDEHGSVVAVIGSPMAREVHYAGRGMSAWRQRAGTAPERLQVNGTRRARGARADILNPGAWSEELLLALHREVLMVPGFNGSRGVAAGELEASVAAGLPMGYEDVAPLRLLVTEAGGLITDLDGNDVLTGNGTVLATNGHIHDEMLGLVRGIPHARDYKALTAQRQ
jgi:histidinol-phosphatase